MTQPAALTPLNYTARVIDHAGTPHVLHVRSNDYKAADKAVRAAAKRAGIKVQYVESCLADGRQP